MGQTHYVGLAGQLALLSEFALRGYNTAIPAPDEGDDAVVYNSATGAMWRLQVKTSMPYRQKKSNSYQFGVQDSQITTPVTPDRWFAFMLHRGTVFHPVLIDRCTLHSYVSARQLGTVAGASRNISFTLHDDHRVTAGAAGSRINLSSHFRDFSCWPPLIQTARPMASGATPYTPRW